MLMVNCGYTYEYIDNHMTLPKLAALTKYWARLPPMNLMIAGIALVLGYDWKAGAKEVGEKAMLAQAKADAVRLNMGAGNG